MLRHMAGEAPIATAQMWGSWKVEPSNNSHLLTITRYHLETGHRELLFLLTVIVSGNRSASRSHNIGLTSRGCAKYCSVGCTSSWASLINRFTATERISNKHDSTCLRIYAWLQSYNYIALKENKYGNRQIIPSVFNRTPQKMYLWDMTYQDSANYIVLPWFWY